LPRLLGEHITVNILAADGLPPIHADPGMIEQILINLAVNARDAMPEGGTLTINAEAVEIGPKINRENPDVRPGRFVCLSVSDTGCGIPPEILPRIFEPFFTTKPTGKGSGLGLATVYGIAKQHQGWVEVQSQPGHGSTFKVFIPVSEKRPAALPTPLNTAPLQGGHESILVVEDEEDVRDFVVQVLKSHGYSVLPAVSGVQALELWTQRKGDIDLLLTDLVMPGGLLGRELAERLTADDPRLAVIYTSGYSPGMTGEDLAVLQGHNFLPKPYRPAKLLDLVRECLDQRPPATETTGRPKTSAI